MQLEFYDNLVLAFKQFCEDNNVPIAKNGVVGTPPTDPEYPIVVIEEIRNTPTYVANVGRQVVSSLGYRFNIYALTKGNKTKQKIAREIAEKVDYFMFMLNGISRTSYNTIENADGGGKLYAISMVYSPQYYENKKLKY